MKQLVALILLTILVSACAKSAGAPAPTPEPTRLLMAPAPTAAPNPSQALATPTAVKPGAPAPSPTEKKGAAPLGTIPAGIAMLNITQEKMADGSIRTTASVAAPDNLGLGQVELAYPETMGMDESATVALKLSPAAQLVSLTPIAAPGKTPDVPAFVYRFSGNVQLYPMMYAELRAVSFDLDQSGPIRRIVESNKPVEWRWIVRPRAAGRQDLVLELSIPVIINGVTSELSTSVLQDLRLTILVNASLAATALTPAPSTETLTQRIIDSMIDNTGALAAAAIGVCGTVLTVLASIVALIAKSKSKSQ